MIKKHIFHIAKKRAGQGINTVDRITFFLLLFLLAAACKKTELPPTVEGNPVFAINATLEGEVLDFVAGEEDYYLFTSFAQDDLGVYSFIGRFEKLVDCESDCLESLEFEIRDFEVNNGGSVSIERALSVDSYSLATGVTTSIDSVLEGYDVVFENLSLANVPLQYQWNLGSGGSTDSIVPNVTFYPLSTGNQQVTLAAFDSGGGCYSEITKSLQFTGDPDPECDLSFVSTSDTTTNELCAQMTGVPPFEYRWEIQNDSIFFTECINFDFSDTLNLTLFAKDALDCSRTRTIRLQENFGNPLSYCSPDFSYQAEARYSINNTSISDSLGLSKVIIRYTDSDGVLFSSENAPQTSADRFEILETSAFMDNENGQPSQLLKVRFTGMLQSQGGDLRQLENGEGVIAVAYPE